MIWSFMSYVYIVRVSKYVLHYILFHLDFYTLFLNFSLVTSHNRLKFVLFVGI